jgi:hypothetical protein
MIKMKNSSELEWSLSGEYRMIFKKLLDKALEKENDDIIIDINFIYTFTRPVILNV